MDYAITCQNDRFFAGCNRFVHFCNLFRHRQTFWLVPRQIPAWLGVILVSDFLDADIFWNINDNWSFSACICKIESFMDDARNIFGITDLIIVFRHRCRHADHVRFLESIFSDAFFSYLASDHNQWNGIHLSGRDSGQSICRAGAACNDTDARFAGSTGVPVSSVYSALFMSGQYVIRFRFVEFIVDVKNRSAWIAEQNFNTFIFQSFNKKGYTSFCFSFHFRFHYNLPISRYSYVSLQYG
ncbi:hypothetical protein SDC9_171959 [bioreactor metagenome]|uniref:Uncharacterized protein n=1 Tax=bioreactor metagenome TaxID=1076179 RepID=A0A645GEP3_9ZZZZ